MKPWACVGAEILPGTQEYEWVSSVVAAVERRTGRTSRWNRQLFEEGSGFKGGKAVADGPLLLSRADVLDPVMRAYDTTAPLTPDQIVAARAAAYVVVHEAVHHLSDPGDDSAAEAVWHGSPEETALEEALADTETMRIETDVIRDIGMDRDVPRILDLHITGDGPYSAYNEGLDGVVHGLAELTDRDPDDIRSTIHQTPMPQRYNAMADLIIDKRLSDLAEHRTEFRAWLAAPLRSELGALAKYQDLDRPAVVTPQRAADLGAEHARRAVREVGKRLTSLRTQYDARADMRRFLGEHTGAGRSATGGGTAAGGGAASGTAAAVRGPASGAAAAAAAVASVLPFRRDRGQAVE
ncbi:hypothetical protein EV652_12380 [Kribbella steppae]|uniref:Uncharacterized protein n=1 Tax=Kribbella steppae TaxID=2512223 RepID=A0A4V2RXP0_9ACTN|nr:hypothetical protein [Kribbella steppae]TCO14876.1 hypothetical protein EV652_12380 [Kribbella steppae]